jgi:hypothetical protein
MVQSLILTLTFRLFYLGNKTLKVERDSIHVTEGVTRHIRVIIQFFDIVIVVYSRITLDKSE